MNETRWKWIAVLALGVVAGLSIEQVLSVRSVSAQPRQWQECFAATLWHAPGRSVSEGQLPNKVRVPPGFVPVGGTSIAARDPGVVFCR
jgi:hypothetical protein